MAKYSNFQALLADISIVQPIHIVHFIVTLHHGLPRIIASAFFAVRKKTLRKLAPMTQRQNEQ